MWPENIELNTEDPPDGKEVLVWVSAPGQNGHWEVDCMTYGRWSRMELLKYKVHGWVEEPPVPNGYRLK